MAWLGGNFSTAEVTVPTTSSSGLVLDWTISGAQAATGDGPGHEADLTPLYVCRAFVGVGVYPGKFGLHLCGCSIALEGKEVLVTTGYAVLRGADLPPR